MDLLRSIIIVVGLFLFSSLKENRNCEQFMRQAKSEDYDVSVLGSLHFQTKDSFETLSERGVREAYFFSCDGDKGFLLIKTHEKRVIYQRIPLSIWQEFKDAPSPEQYCV